MALILELETIQLLRKYKLLVLMPALLGKAFPPRKKKEIMTVGGKKSLKVYFKTLSRSSSQTTVLFIDPPCFTMMPSRVHLYWPGGVEENKGFIVKTSRVWLQVIQATTLPQMKLQ